MKGIMDMKSYMTREETLHFKSEMVRAGFTVGSLALALNMSRTTLTSRITGKTDFSKLEMERIATLFSKPPEDIFFAA